MKVHFAEEVEVNGHSQVSENVQLFRSFCLNIETVSKYCKTLTAETVTSHFTRRSKQIQYMNIYIVKCFLMNINLLPIYVDAHQAEMLMLFIVYFYRYFQYFFIGNILFTPLHLFNRSNELLIK